MIQLIIRFLGSSYFPSPISLQKKKATINVQNNDNKCFLYAILAAQNYHRIKRDRERVTHYTDLLTTLKYEESWFPMKLVNISKFESRNPGFGINILTYSEKDKNTTYFKHPNVDIIYRAKNGGGTQIYLLLLQKGNIITTLLYN